MNTIKKRPARRVNKTKVVNNKKTVYLHKNALTNEVVYVGAGTSKRPYDFRQRSQEHKDLIESVGVNVEIVQSDMTIGQAYELEVELINKYGIENLFNLKITGSGTQPMSQSQKDAISKYQSKRDRTNDPIPYFALTNTKIDINQVPTIIKELDLLLVEKGMNAKDAERFIAEKYNVRPSTIYRIRKRQGRYIAFPQTTKLTKVSGGWKSNYINN